MRNSYEADDPQPLPRSSRRGATGGAEGSYLPQRELLGRPAHGNHIVQFYEDHEFLARTVAHFVGSGLLGGEPSIIIATPEHREAFRRALDAASFDVERACSAGQLILLDASTTLAAFMVGDLPDGELFEQHVGAVLDTAIAATGSDVTIRAYGEMVDVLWRAGNGAAALRLEEMWAALGERYPFSLLCAYGMASFGTDEHADTFERVCKAHTHVLPTERYCDLRTEDERLRRIGTLEQRSRALENEVERRTRLEGGLREALAVAKRAEEDLRDLVENGLEGIHWVGPDGIILFANQAELDLLGYSRDEYVGRPIQDFHADKDVIDDILQRLCSGDTLRDREARLRCKDGTVKHVLIHSNVYWREGEFVHTRCFTRDVTERKRAEDALRAIAGELEHANRMKDEFLATVSHELRTPLNAILGWVRMLRVGALDAEKRERALATIERNANSQAQLIEDLLDVSRIISGKLRLDVGTVDLPRVVENAIEVVRLAAEAKAISIHRILDPSACPILGDAERLEQVVWNLLTNAVKFTPKGGSIEIALRKRDSCVEIVVADDGQGIAPDFVGDVFERFRQADASTARKHGGLGLGLAIVKSLVELHGGSVAAASAGLGMGATFTVCLPVSPLRTTSFERPPVLPLLRERSGFDCPKNMAGVHLLVVDDEPDARELLAEMLSSCKARVDVASSVAEAIAFVQERRPDIVISDIGMPGEDGYALIGKLRALPAAKGGRTPAVALTAYARFEDRMKALIAGFNMHVPKPVEPAELLAVLSSLTTMFGRERA